MLEASFRPVNCSIRSDVVGHEIKPTDARPPSRGGRTRESRSRRIALPIISLREACLALLASNTENIHLVVPSIESLRERRHSCVCPRASRNSKNACNYCERTDRNKQPLEMQHILIPLLAFPSNKRSFQSLR